MPFRDTYATLKNAKSELQRELDSIGVLADDLQKRALIVHEKFRTLEDKEQLDHQLVSAITEIALMKLEIQANPEFGGPQWSHMRFLLGCTIGSIPGVLLLVTG